MSLFASGNQGNAYPDKQNFGSVLSFSIFWKSLRRIGINSLNVWENSPMKSSGPGLVFLEGDLITDSASLLVIVCSDFLFLHGSGRYLQPREVVCL